MQEIGTGEDRSGKETRETIDILINRGFKRRRRRRRRRRGRSANRYNYREPSPPRNIDDDDDNDDDNYDDDHDPTKTHKSKGERTWFSMFTPARRNGDNADDGVSAIHSMFDCSSSGSYPSLASM